MDNYMDKEVWISALVKDSALYTSFWVNAENFIKRYSEEALSKIEKSSLEASKALGKMEAIKEFRHQITMFEREKKEEKEKK